MKFVKCDRTDLFIINSIDGFSKWAVLDNIFFLKTATDAQHYSQVQVDAVGTGSVDKIKSRFGLSSSCPYSCLRSEY